MERIDLEKVKSYLKLLNGVSEMNMNDQNSDTVIDEHNRAKHI